MKSDSSPGKPNPECVHYKGDVPCVKKRVCWDCDEFTPHIKRALIVKFGAPGDALRTTPILKRLRAEGYDDITWICDPPSLEILSLAVNIDRLIPFNAEAIVLIMTERFDTVFSFDKAPAALSIAMMAQSDDKRGFGRTDHGRLIALDDKSDYALRLGIDDDLKFRTNDKTVPQIIFEMAGYSYQGEPYELCLENAEKFRPRAENKPSGVIALNIGVGPRWPSKAWPDQSWIALAQLMKKAGLRPLFVGGEAERGRLANYGARAGVECLPPAPLAIFAETLAAADAVVSCDSLGLHVALAVRTPTIGLFCSTSVSEIEWFGCGEALHSEKGPCYNARCMNWPGCMSEISPQTVFDRLAKRVPLLSKS